MCFLTQSFADKFNAYFLKILYVSDIISYLFFSSDFTLCDNFWVHPGLLNNISLLFFMAE